MIDERNLVKWKQLISMKHLMLRYRDGGNTINDSKQKSIAIISISLSNQNIPTEKYRRIHGNTVNDSNNTRHVSITVV